MMSFSGQFTAANIKDNAHFGEFLAGLLLANFSCSET